MFRRTNSPRHDSSELQGNGNPSALSALLTVMGNDARLEGKFETNSLVISKGGFFNGNVVKLQEAEAGKPPVHLVKEKQLIQSK